MSETQSYKTVTFSTVESSASAFCALAHYNDYLEACYERAIGDARRAFWAKAIQEHAECQADYDRGVLV